MKVKLNTHTVFNIYFTKMLFYIDFKLWFKKKKYSQKLFNTLSIK